MDVQPISEFVIANKCNKIYKQVSDFVKSYRNNPDEIIINECIFFMISTYRSTYAKTGSQVQACHFSVSLIQSFKDDLISVIVKQGGNLEGPQVKWIYSKSAFKNSIQTGIVKNINLIFASSKKIFC